MPNGKASQVLFRNQRAADGIYRVQPVGSKAVFTSIQAAITQAFADGFVSDANPATIEIYPGVYAENIALSSGIHLQGVNGGLRNGTGVVINGTLTYGPVAGTIGQNVVNVNLVAIQPTAASTQAVIFSGTAPSRLNFRQCSILSPIAAGGTTGLVASSNSNAASTLRITDTIIQANLTTDTEMLQVAGAANVQIFGGQGGLNNNSGGTIATAVSVNGNAIFDIRLPGFVSGAFTQVFTLGSATAAINVEKSIVQNTLAGGHIFNATATGTIRCRHAGLFTANLAGKICNASAAATLIIHSCDFSGTQNAPFAAIDPIVNSVGAGSYNMEQDQAYKEFQVGRGIGYQTIQSAITAAAATVAGNRKVVKIPPGSYNENLTLAPNVDLAADTETLVNGNQSAPVSINGTHTLALAVNTDIVLCKNINFNSQGVNTNPLIAVSGAGSGLLKLSGCRLTKIFAGATSLVSVTNTAGCKTVLEECFLTFQAVSGAVFDFSGSDNSCQLIIKGNMAASASFSPAMNFGPSAFGTAVAIPFFTSSATGSVCEISQANIQGETSQFFSSNGNDVISIDHCDITQVVHGEGTFLQLNDGGFNFYISECTIFQEVDNQPNGLPSLVRDNGTQASATVTLAANPADGDNITVNGAIFTARVAPTQTGEFQIGGTTAITASNLRDTINISLDNGNDVTTGILALIYATSAANMVTIKSFGDSSGNAYGLATSAPGTLVISGATFAGGIDGSSGEVQLGVNSVSGQAGSNPNSKGGAVVSSPVFARQLYSSTINQLPVTPSGANAGEFIVGTGIGQYATIQLALNAADALVSGVRKVVLVSPGGYVENLVLKDNVDLVARSFDGVGINSAPVNIIGTLSYTPAAGSSILIKGVNFSLSAGSAEVGVSAFSATLQFQDCSLVKQVNEAAPMFLMSNVNGSSFIFNACTIEHSTDSGATFSIAGGSNLRFFGGRTDPNNASIGVGPFTLPISNAIVFVLGVGSRLFVSGVIIGASVQTMISLSATSVSQVLFSTILQNVDNGQMVQFTGSGRAEFQHCEINVSPGNGNSNLLARSGVQASATVTVASNPTGGARATGGFIVNSISTAGDTVTVDGVVLTAVAGAPIGPQFQLDAVPANEAANIAAAILANVPAVSATNAGNIVNAVSRASGAAGNAINLLSSNAVAISAPAPTMTGGTNGDTATINGVVFTATIDPAYQPNNEFQVGGTTTITSTNLAAAVNNSGTAGIFKTIFARSAVNVATLTARKTGTAGNAFTLASSVPIVLVPSEATFAGGAAGGVAVFVYSNLGFQQLDEIESSVIVVAEPTAVVSV